MNTMWKNILFFVFVVMLLKIAVKAQTDNYDVNTTPTEESSSIDEELFETITAFENRVNGGQEAKRIVPFQVSLQAYRRNRWRHFCGGAIITEHHVLTAAHCVDKMKPEDIHVVAGTLTWNSGGQRHRVAATRVHPQFSMSPRITNDIAVLKVQPAFNLRKSSMDIISLGGTSRIGAGVNVRITGWGAITPTANGGLPDKLQQLDYKTITNEECARKGFRVTPNEVCALSFIGQGSCMVIKAKNFQLSFKYLQFFISFLFIHFFLPFQGDSGGPLVTTQGIPQLVGIVSYGSATCAQGRPDVYTRVSSFLPYINRVITNEIP